MSMENETLNITIEEVEEESAVVESTTIVDETLVHLLAKIAVRRDESHQKRRPLYNAMGVGIILLALYFAYTYFITKTNTTRGPAIVAIMIIMGGMLLWYVNQPLLNFMENRMKPFMGQAWHYRVTEDGVGLLFNHQETVFAWSEITGWWLEDGFYMMEVGGQAIAIRQDSLEPEDEEVLKSLLYIYLGNAMEVVEA